MGPCLPLFPLGQGYVVRLVGQRRTERLDEPGNVWGLCDIGLSAYEEEPVCEGWPDAWTVRPPDGANPWYPGPFLPYEYDVPQTETRFIGQRVHLSVHGRIGTECWFDSVEVQLIPPPVTIPTLSSWALALAGLAMAAAGVLALRR